MGNLGGFAPCFICGLILGAIILSYFGISWFWVAETEYVNNKVEIEETEENMHEYENSGENVSPLVEDLPIVYRGDIQNVPGATLGDTFFDHVEGTYLKIDRFAELYSIVESRSCVDSHISVNCKVKQSDSSSTSNSDRWSTKQMRTKTICTYSYALQFTTDPQMCVNDFIDDTVFTSATYYSNQYCNNLSDTSAPIYEVTAHGDAEFQAQCATFSSKMNFLSPCQGTNCVGSTKINEYNVGVFHVSDLYIFDKYMNLSPVAETVSFPSATTDDYITCECTDNCNYMYSGYDSTNEEICDRFNTNLFELGDQKISWIGYHGEEISICTNQKYNEGATPEFSLEQISLEGDGSFAEETMDVDLDIVSKDELTKVKCIEMMREDNDDAISTMRMLCAFMLIGSCICFFCSFGAVFDMMTDILTFFPQLIGSFFCLDGAIQQLEDFVDYLVYMFSCCVGSTFGLFWFLFWWGIIWTLANAGNIIALIFGALGMVSAGVFVGWIIQSLHNKKLESEANNIENPAPIQRQVNQGVPQQSQIVHPAHHPPPNQGYAPAPNPMLLPAQNQVYPLPQKQGYSSQNQGYPSQNQGYVPPNQGYAAPNQVYAAPPNHAYVAPPNQAYAAPPNQAYAAPPNQAYAAPPNQTYAAPPNQDYVAPPNQVYPPQNQNSMYAQPTAPLANQPHVNIQHPY